MDRATRQTVFRLLDRNLRSGVVGVLILLVIGLVGEAGNDSTAVFECSFGPPEKWDVNYDGWPDHWERKTGSEYPHYVNIAIQDDSSVEGNKCLRIDLDGAAAAIASPPIQVMSRFSYVFVAQLKAENLKNSSVVMMLSFRDASGHELQTAKSEAITSTTGWQTISIGRVEPKDSAVDHAIVSLQVFRGNKGDLQGRVSLASLRLERYPRIIVTTNNPCNVYTERDGVEINCVLSGIREQNPEIDFQLLDGANQELQHEHFPLDARRIINKQRTAEGKDSEDATEGYEGVRTWKPSIPDFGYYRIVVQMMNAKAKNSVGEGEPFEKQTVDLVVVPPLGEKPQHGEFGWSLPGDEKQLSFQELSRLLPQVGVSWIKVPVWFDATDQHRGDELIRFVELLSASYIDVVGIVDRPPQKPKAGTHLQRELSIADVLLQDTGTWAPSLEPVMSRLALRVRWWQLGRDNDNSMINLPKLNSKIDDLRTTLFRFGQDVRMGLCADWEGTELPAGKVSWDFTQLTLPSPVTETKFEELLKKPKQESAQRWISIDPPPPSSFPLKPNEWDIAAVTPNNPQALGASPLIPALVHTAVDTPNKQQAARDARTRAFVHRIIEAKLRGADAIFVTKPFDDENGLMRANGMPAELLLPWRTTATMLGGAKYLGVLPLPNESPNHIFVRPDGQVVMVVWNSQPTHEKLYLGENVRQYDVLGRSVAVSKQGHEQEIVITETPSFVLGLHEAIARWRMNLHFETRHVSSDFSRPHHNSLLFKNFFPQGVGATVKIVVLQDDDLADGGARKDAATNLTQDRWIIEPPHANFQLAAGAEAKFPFDIKLKTALYGKQPVRIDFVVEADERIEFSVYDEMEVGTKELKLEVRSQIDKDGSLVVEQRMTNRTDKLADFKCHLRLPGEKPQRTQVYRLGRDVDRKIYRFPNGQKLLGKEMFLEIEEVNGERKLKYKFVAGNNPPNLDQEETQKPAPAKPTDKSAPADTARPLAQLRS